MRNRAVAHTPVVQIHCFAVWLWVYRTFGGVDVTGDAFAVYIGLN